jgi:hypothetical protein
LGDSGNIALSLNGTHVASSAGSVIIEGDKSSGAAMDSRTVQITGPSETRLRLDGYGGANHVFHFKGGTAPRLSGFTLYQPTTGCTGHHIYGEGDLVYNTAYAQSGFGRGILERLYFRGGTVGQSCIFLKSAEYYTFRDNRINPTSGVHGVHLEIGPSPEFSYGEGCWEGTNIIAIGGNATGIELNGNVDGVSGMKFNLTKLGGNLWLRAASTTGSIGVKLYDAFCNNLQNLHIENCGTSVQLTGTSYGNILSGGSQYMSNVALSAAGSVFDVGANCSENVFRDWYVNCSGAGTRRMINDAGLDNTFEDITVAAIDGSSYFVNVLNNTTRLKTIKCYEFNANDSYAAIIRER